MTAGRLLQELEVCVHIGCCKHRLESITGIGFDGPGVKKNDGNGPRFGNAILEVQQRGGSA